MKFTGNGDKLDAKQLVGSISAWLATDAGKQEIKESAVKARQAVDTLNKARAVETRELHEPVTV